MEVSGDKSNQEQYQMELKQGVKIFEESFKGLQKSKFEAQKDEYKKAMGEALKAIQDSASALTNKQLMQMKEKLSNDTNNYYENPSSENLERVQKDIQSMKESTQ